MPTERCVCDYAYICEGKFLSRVDSPYSRLSAALTPPTGQQIFRSGWTRVAFSTPGQQLVRPQCRTRTKLVTHTKIVTRSFTLESEEHEHRVESVLSMHNPKCAPEQVRINGELLPLLDLTLLRAFMQLEHSIECCGIIFSNVPMTAIVLMT